MNGRIKKLICRFRQLHLPTKLVVIHTLIILVSMALYPTGVFVPDIPYDDVYIIFCLVPGIHIWLIAGQILNLFFPWLLTKMSLQAASILCVVFIPGVIGIIIGGLQWYIIGKIILQLREEKQTRFK